MALRLIESQHGQAGLHGSVRGIDERGHQIFVIHLKNAAPLYGEWRPRWVDENSFDVEIIRFGYLDKHNVDNPNPIARWTFSHEQRRMIEELIRSIFSDPEVQNEHAPFAGNPQGFSSGVHFLPGWIIET
jgi:hypothetical protein